MASGIRTLANMNQGAAQVLDNVEFQIADATVPPDKTDVDADAEEEPPSGLVMANVQNSLNIREEPSTDASKVGLLYADCGGEILETTDGWTKIKSGNVIGWASNDYLFFGAEAQEVARSVVADCSYDFDLDIGFIVAALVVFMLAYVFSYGESLQIESDETL